MSTAIDYGYGEAQPDYGYGDAQPDMDYGYGDTSPPPAQEPINRRRHLTRRCSVTKFSLEEASKNEGSPEAEMVQSLNAAERLQQFRRGGN